MFSFPKRKWGKKKIDFGQFIKFFDFRSKDSFNDKQLNMQSPSFTEIKHRDREKSIRFGEQYETESEKIKAKNSKN